MSIQYTYPTIENNLANIGISETEIILYVISLLQVYDKANCNEEKETCKINPYQDTLYFATQEGKQIEISKDLQQKVIVQYKLMNPVAKHDPEEDAEYNCSTGLMFLKTLWCIAFLLLMLYLLSLTRYGIKYL